MRCAKPRSEQVPDQPLPQHEPDDVAAGGHLPDEPGASGTEAEYVLANTRLPEVAVGRTRVDRQEHAKHKVQAQGRCAAPAAQGRAGDQHGEGLTRYRHRRKRQVDGEPGKEDHKEGEPDDEERVPGHPRPEFLHRQNHIRQGRNVGLIIHSTHPPENLTTVQRKRPRYEYRTTRNCGQRISPDADEFRSMVGA